MLTVIVVLKSHRGSAIRSNTKAMTTRQCRYGECWFAENLRYLTEVVPVEIGGEDDYTASYVYGYDGYSPSAAMQTMNYSSTVCCTIIMRLTVGTLS